MADGDPLVLVIEDEAQIRRFLRATLPGHGYRVLEAGNAHDGLVRAAEHRPDLVILDLGLPDRDGLDVTRELREWTRTPIVVLSARDQEAAKVAALDAGADDYVTKPFGIAELLARMRVALRHAAESTHDAGDPVFTLGPWRVDLARHQVFVDEVEVHLTPIEYSLLAVLVRNPGKLITQKQLLQQVWGPAYATEGHYLRVYMGQLRRKLEADPTRPRYLITEPGIGYRLRVE